MPEVEKREKVELSPEDEGILKDVANFLNKYPQWFLWIVTKEHKDIVLETHWEFEDGLKTIYAIMDQFNIDPESLFELTREKGGCGSCPKKT